MFLVVFRAQLAIGATRDNADGWFHGEGLVDGVSEWKAVRFGDNTELKVVLSRGGTNLKLSPVDSSRVRLSPPVCLLNQGIGRQVAAASKFPVGEVQQMQSAKPLNTAPEAFGCLTRPGRLAWAGFTGRS